MKHYEVIVHQVFDETPAARSFQLAIPAELSEKFSYSPGQYLTLQIPYRNGSLYRCYSLCSSPHNGELPSILVKRVRKGHASNWLCDNIQAGGTLSVLPPTGNFVPRSLDTNLLLIAAGSGISPIFSILKSALHAGKADVYLIYANHDADSVIFAGQIENLQQQYASRFSVTHWLDGQRGLPSAESIASLATNWTHADCFLCGPQPFMDTTLIALQTLGVPADRVHQETFATSFEAAGSDGVAEEDDGREKAVVEVNMGNRIEQLACGYSEYLLNAILRAGIKAPNSCRTGNCASCKCKLEEGEVVLDSNSVLDEDDIKAGWIVSCRAKPQSGFVRLAISEQDISEQFDSF